MSRTETAAYFQRGDERRATSCTEKVCVRARVHAFVCVCARVKRINIENSDKEAIISIQSIFYPPGLLGGWR